MTVHRDPAAGIAARLDSLRHRWRETAGRGLPILREALEARARTLGYGVVAFACWLSGLAGVMAAPPGARWPFILMAAAPIAGAFAGLVGSRLTHLHLLAPALAASNQPP